MKVYKCTTCIVLYTSIMPLANLSCWQRSLYELFKITGTYNPICWDCRSERECFINLGGLGPKPELVRWVQ